MSTRTAFRWMLITGAVGMAGIYWFLWSNWIPAAVLAMIAAAAMFGLLGYAFVREKFYADRSLRMSMRKPSRAEKAIAIIVVLVVCALEVWRLWRTLRQ